MKVTYEDLKDAVVLRDVVQAFTDAQEAFEILASLCEQEKFRITTAILDAPSFDAQNVMEKRAELKALMAWKTIVTSVLDKWEEQGREASAQERRHQVGAGVMA